jgi:hypothetical protein
MDKKNSNNQLDSEGGTQITKAIGRYFRDKLKTKQKSEH